RGLQANFGCFERSPFMRIANVGHGYQALREYAGQFGRGRPRTVGPHRAQLIYARRMTSTRNSAGRPRGPATAASPATADRLALMQTFVRIVEAGSLSAAAAQIGATQPTISRRLQALERTLGVRLLQRSTHSMNLTEDGQRCFDGARELLLNWAAFDSVLR